MRDRVKAATAAAGGSLLPQAKTKRGQPLDPVARFHLGNGARLERLNFLGDRSDNGMRQSHGLMVNYLYAPNQIETNHEAFAERGQIAAASAVRKLLPTRRVTSEPAKGSDTSKTAALPGAEAV